MTNKQKYKEFCKKELDIPIFSKYWWLDAVCGEDNWDVLLYEKGGQIWASFLYYMQKNQIAMPKLTQTMGIYIKYPANQKYYKKLSWEKEIIFYFVDNLPKVDSFVQNFHYDFTNWLPFYWKGFTQNTRYTYVIENITLENLENNLETDIRRRRRKADKLGVKVIESNNIKNFYKINSMTFQRQNMKIPYSFEFLKKLYENCRDNNAVKIYFAKDSKDNIVAVNFLVYDNSTVYYLMGGIDPSFKDLGGMDMILHKSIKFAIESGRKFDFEGSMIESIEKYFRSFGAVQKRYFTISKTNSKFLRLKTALKDVVKAIVR